MAEQIRVLTWKGVEGLIKSLSRVHTTSFDGVVNVAGRCHLYSNVTILVSAKRTLSVVKQSTSVAIFSDSQVT